MTPDNVFGKFERYSLHSRFFLSILIAVISLSNYSCKKTDPAGPADQKSDSRSYSWSIDTVRSGTAPLFGIWGNNESDIWFLGIAEDEFSGSLFHYNGNMAVPVDLPVQIQPSAIFGFSSGDVWVSNPMYEGKDSLSFWHYNGSWICKEKFNFPGYEGCVITDIWGDSPNNIYATGIAVHINSEREVQSYIAMLFHYDGNQWTRVNIPDIHREFSRIRRGINGSDKYYILSSATVPGDNYSYRDTVKIIEFDGKNVKTLFSTYTKRDEGFWISEIDKQMYVINDSKIYRFRNEQLELFLDNPYQNHRIEIWGRNENDMFLAMKDGITHYNGSNIEYIYKFNPEYITLKDLVYFQNSVFILAYDSSTYSNILIKGTARK